MTVFNRFSQFGIKCSDSAHISCWSCITSSSLAPCASIADSSLKLSLFFFLQSSHLQTSFCDCRNFKSSSVILIQLAWTLAWQSVHCAFTLHALVVRKHTLHLTLTHAKSSVLDRKLGSRNAKLLDYWVILSVKISVRPTSMYCADGRVHSYYWKINFL